jgi:hypothetical protein
MTRRSQRIRSRIDEVADGSARRRQPQAADGHREVRWASGSRRQQLGDERSIRVLAASDDAFAPPGASVAVSEVVVARSGAASACFSDVCARSVTPVAVS